MNQRWVGWIVSTSVLLFVATGCEELYPAAFEPTPYPTLPPLIITVTPASTAVPPTATVKPTVIQPTITLPAAAVPKSSLTCPAGVAVPANAQLAAKVNGQGIPLDVFNRQIAQAQSAFVQQGVDIKSQAGQEALKSLRQQVLDQMINEVVIAQEAAKEGKQVTDVELNARLAQMIQDAGSVDKLNEYLNKNQLTLSDLCTQVRASMLGEMMIDVVTGALPTQVEQVHVRQILVSTLTLAQSLRDRVLNGEDFAALAKLNSMDEMSKANGGDLGWLPKGVLAPELDSQIFQLEINQTSQVIKTDLGYHIVQVIGKEKSRPLPPELVQPQRQQAFLAWLQAKRETYKIERLVQ